MVQGKLTLWRNSPHHFRELSLRITDEQSLVQLLAQAFPRITAPPDAGLQVLVNGEPALPAIDLHLIGKYLHFGPTSRASLQPQFRGAEVQGTGAIGRFIEVFLFQLSGGNK